MADGIATGRFVYGRSYRERRDAVELDPAELLLTDELFETSRMNGFFGVIRDAMPDHWGRLVIERQRAEPPNEFDYLLHGADDRAGALGFGVEPEPPQPRSTFASPRQLGDLQRQAAALLAGDGSGQASMEHMLLLGTSMGGARPKVVVEDAGALWLAKLSRPDDRWNQPRVEAGMLALARACGIDTPTGHIRTVGDRDALLVRRFDRERAEAGYRRARMASALTLLRCDEGVTECSHLPRGGGLMTTTSGSWADALRDIWQMLDFAAPSMSSVPDFMIRRAGAAHVPLHKPGRLRILPQKKTRPPRPGRLTNQRSRLCCPTTHHANLWYAVCFTPLPTVTTPGPCSHRRLPPARLDVPRPASAQRLAHPDPRRHRDHARKEEKRHRPRLAGCLRPPAAYQHPRGHRRHRFGRPRRTPDGVPSAFWDLPSRSRA